MPPILRHFSTQQNEATPAAITRNLFASLFLLGTQHQPTNAVVQLTVTSLALKHEEKYINFKLAALQCFLHNIGIHSALQQLHQQQ
jgi:hypothetical protein